MWIKIYKFVHYARGYSTKLAKLREFVLHLPLYALPLVIIGAGALIALLTGVVVVDGLIQMFKFFGMW